MLATPMIDTDTNLYRSGFTEDGQLSIHDNPRYGNEVGDVLRNNGFRLAHYHSLWFRYGTQLQLNLWFDSPLYL